MKDSIQDIINKIKDKNWYDELDTTGTKWIELRWEETHLLLDHITDLQDNRINKAIEYIIENRHLSMFNDGKKPEED